MSDSTPALILVDVINDFYDPKGPNHYPESARTLDEIGTLLETARKADRLIIHAVERHRPGVVDAEHHKLPAHCAMGSFAADFFPGYGPVDRDRDIVVAKRRYSAFFGTDLALLLHENAVGRVVIVGVKTNVCIRATVQDAFANGLDVIVPREATNSNRPHLEEAAIEDISRYFGTVCQTSDALALLRGADQ